MLFIDKPSCFEKGEKKGRFDELVTANNIFSNLDWPDIQVLSIETKDARLGSNSANKAIRS